MENAVVEHPPVARAPALGTLIDDLWQLRESKRAAEKVVEGIAKQYAAVEEQLMERMEQEGTQRAAGRHGHVSVSESIVPSVKDWDGFYKFIHRHKFYHLLERRAAVKACRELFESKGRIPGVEPFVKRTLRLLSIGEGE